MRSTLLFLTFIFLSKLQIFGQKVLSLKQQQEDFEIFKGALNEGHAGLFNFITKENLENECDSIFRTFNEGLTPEEYYLKLRFVTSSLHHGHTRITLPTSGSTNYKMNVLDSIRVYLPFQFLIIQNQLIIAEDCSKEQHTLKYSVVKKINDIPVASLLKNMLQYMPADGINQSYKYFCLYNYFYFHYLYSLSYPDNKMVVITTEQGKRFNIHLLEPKTIDSIFISKNHKSISHYGKQLEFNPSLTNDVAYLRITSFFKGLIEQFQQSYEVFLDSCFSEIKRKGINKLIIDVRDNEGGGDNYENLLFSYLNEHPFVSNELVRVAGKHFIYKQYATHSSDAVRAFIENPDEFLKSDSTLILKDVYSEQQSFSPKVNLFQGNIYVLTNGGTFSAASNFIRLLYNYRLNNKRRIVRFIGEENGGDIYSQCECAGQSYVITLPNSRIKIDMPFLCFGELNKIYPTHLLPDFKIYQQPANFRLGTDKVLDFVTKHERKIDKPLKD